MKEENTQAHAPCFLMNRGIGNRLTSNTKIICHTQM